MRAPDRDAWVTAGEIAEYTYCPRAHWYARTIPDAPVPRDAARRGAAGERYHARTSRSVVHREDRGSGYAALVVVGALLLVGLSLYLLGWV